MADAAGSCVFRDHSADGLSELEIAQYPAAHADCVLFTRDCGMCHDLEEHVVASCGCADCWVYDYWVFCAGDESDGQYWDGECGGGDEEELYGCEYFCFLLCGECELFGVLSRDGVREVLLIWVQIVGPQLVKSQTLKRHYPELWLGIIIRYVHGALLSAFTRTDHQSQLLHRDRARNHAVLHPPS